MSQRWPKVCATFCNGRMTRPRGRTSGSKPSSQVWTFLGFVDAKSQPRIRAAEICPETMDRPQFLCLLLLRLLSFGPKSCSILCAAPDRKWIWILWQGIGPDRSNSGNKTVVQPRLEGRPVDVRADKDNFLPSVTPRLLPMGFHIGLSTIVGWPSVFRNRSPPCAQRFNAGQRPGE